MVAFPNPTGFDIYAAVAAGDRPAAEEIGDLADAARVAGVEPGTIRTWMSRHKIEPIDHRDGGYLFHLPTIALAAAAGAAHRVHDPGANRRGRRRATA